MADDNRVELTDDFERVPERERSTRPTGDPSEIVEKGEDFSSEAEPTEESLPLTESTDEKAKIAELEDRLLRLAAEHENFRKRMARQQDELVRNANDRIFTELLEVVDNFERALQHTTEDADANAIRKGTEMIYGQLLSLLAKHGISPIEALGKPFDPQWHEALMQTTSAEFPEGIVALELGKGYQQGNRVLRHSKVGVSKGKE